MRTTSGLWMVMAVSGLMLAAVSAPGADSSRRWVGRFDMGGTIPEDATLTKFDGPVSGGKMKIDPGFQFDLSAGYKITPWLEVGPELGFTFNFVDEIGGWSYHSTTLGQILLMANVRLEYPPQGRVAPFIGAGVGGVASFLTFGGGSGYYYYEPDGMGDDFSLGVQAFGGLRYKFDNDWSLGVTYRYLLTDRQQWTVDWWYGPSFDIAVDSIQMHSFCLEFSGSF